MNSTIPAASFSLYSEPSEPPASSQRAASIGAILIRNGRLSASDAEEVVRGQRARWAHHDPRPCLIPPDWSGGYTSLFALQQKESAPASM